MKRIKSLLFGAVEAIEIHSHSAPDAARLRASILASLRSFGEPVPVLQRPAQLGMEFIMVHYGPGLLRPAHADVTVLN